MNVTVAFEHNGGEQTVSSVTPLVMNQWNHVMGTYDGERLRIYVNGYPQGDVATAQIPAISDDPLLVGSEAFAGRLDEVTLYSRALAPDEVRDIFRYQGKLVEVRSGTWITVDDEPPVSTYCAPTAPTGLTSRQRAWRCTSRRRTRPQASRCWNWVWTGTTPPRRAAPTLPVCRPARLRALRPGVPTSTRRARGRTG